MRKYKHWLVIDYTRKNEEEVTELLDNLIKYKKEHNATVELFHRNSGTFEHIFSVECSQSYNELDLPCNSGFNSFYRLQRKPSNIYKGRDFRDYVQRMNKKLVIE